MTVSVVLPVRLGSSRLPGKPFLEIDGRPLLWHVWHNLRGSDVSEILVATDSTRVAEAVRAWGGTVVLTPGQYASGTERICAIAELLQEERVVNVQADEFTFTASDLNRFVSEWDGTGAEMLTPVYRLDGADALNDVNTVKVILGDDREALGFTRSAPSCREPGTETAPQAWGHVGVYGYSKRMLELYHNLPPSPNELGEGLEQMRFLDNGHTFTTYDIGQGRFAINTAADLKRARART